MSFGVAATAPGEPFAFAEVFARADAALYEAKRAGRDRVRTATSRLDDPRRGAAGRPRARYDALTSPT